MNIKTTVGGLAVVAAFAFMPFANAHDSSGGMGPVHNSVAPVPTMKLGITSIAPSIEATPSASPLVKAKPAPQCDGLADNCELNRQVYP